MKRIAGIFSVFLILFSQPPTMLEAQPATKYDILLKGAHVIDPKNLVDKVTDVAVVDGHIASVADNISVSDARKVINLTGLYLTPGLIDIHVHIYPRVGLPPGSPMQASIQPDAFSFRSGVTTMVDAGTTGWKEFPEFKRRIVEGSKTRILAFLNIVGGGMEMGLDDNVSEMDANAAAQMALKNPGVIVGFKSAHYAGKGWPSVENAVKAGNMAHVPVMVDFGYLKGERSLDALFSQKLRPGDIYTHCFAGHRVEVLDNGALNPVMEQARKKGIYFDIGFGAGSFYWFVADAAYKAHFYPDSISTDLHMGSMNGGMKDMANVLSEMMALGSSIQEVVKMSTMAPAREINHLELGNLDIGSEADIAVFKLEKGNFGFLDSAGARHSGTSRLVTELTLRKGMVMWDLNGLATQDWKAFPYKKGLNDPYRK
ncbi:amidohydrolase/deacetylase family metallohydrolase [Edaphobacter albus]|uniref:amidohydrolase/deacetylase family metallohydrolase n=1 Tax=Edaphobacter sp. 4G125 TaxID=2763071 RepID=UPI001646D482|nr:amidohydrolase/deacetylase family metallohydrolase [Edaphobacter sp. 4G125]QNI37972.1 amidohydrolase/deacetylase family metallohydrolase [Edaphobacter sp. 4G125]